MQVLTGAMLIIWPIFEHRKSMADLATIGVGIHNKSLILSNIHKFKWSKGSGYDKERLVKQYL